MIGLKILLLFLKQWEEKPKPKTIAPCTSDFSHAGSNLQAIAEKSD